ncbi:hypothetical protein V501_08950 [Pseudogymnoascus sp. VKM F-4519 (FW-2642)]|nr:hypothetical protein V501_08950 [Pseudogymnoascus sp. VKM F-4519 (FW-2642)]
MILALQEALNFPRQALLRWAINLARPVFSKAAGFGDFGVKMYSYSTTIQKKKSGEGDAAPLSFEESFFKIVLKVYGAWDIPSSQRSVPTPVTGRENGASISGKLFRMEKRDILAAYAIDNGLVQAWLHPSRPPPSNHG